MKAAYDAKKKSLPLVCFMGTFMPNQGKNGKSPEGCWRVQSAVRLNGLIMHDFDKLSKYGVTPDALYHDLPAHWFDDKQNPCAILYAGKTPSNDGLRLVSMANPDLDIEQNQEALLAQIHALKDGKYAAIEKDCQCINADRGSFMVDNQSVYYMNDLMFDYDNEAYDRKFGDYYRKGHVTGSTRNSKSTGSTTKKAHAETANYPDSYHDVPYGKILQTWFDQNGGIPQQGDRHKVMLLLVNDIRYICDNNVGFIKHVVMQQAFVRSWVESDGAGKELDDIIGGACDKELWWGTPKRLRSVLDAVGLGSAVKSAGNALSDEEELAVYQNFNDRIRPLLTEPYISASKVTTETNLLPSIFVSGAMFCTLMTRAWYEHYDGKLTRLNPSVFGIGMPASGKSFADRLDDQIMAVMRVADAPARMAEKEYKRKLKERASSSKEAKGEALQQPDGMIRYLPAKTSNAIFFRRLENAKETIDGDVIHLHLYMFDTELESQTAAQKGGQWIGKHDLELKAFQNEKSGVDYANNDSINDNVPIYWNQVITGTPVSLSKKINLANVNDGLCSRLCLCKIWPEKYKMLPRGNRESNHDVDVKLKEWGYRFDTVRGELKLEKLVDHVYDLCERFAMQAEELQDDVLDFLRKRAAFYAIWFTIPRILGRQWETYRDHKTIEIDEEDLSFASIIYEAVVYWQNYYFGAMLQESWTNAANEHVVRKPSRGTTAEEFKALPTEFTYSDLRDTLSEEAKRKRCQVWKSAGYITKISNKHPACFKKLVSDIVI